MCNSSKWFLVLLTISLVVASRVSGELSTEEKSFLEAVRTLRIETLQKVEHGGGTAEIAVTEFSRFEDDNEVSRVIPKHKVEFLFLGTESLRKDYAPGRKDLISRSLLLNENRSVEYHAKGAKKPASVRIDKYDDSLIWFDTEVRNCCYEGFAQLPFPAEESVFWEKLETVFETKVTRNGTVVRLTFGLVPQTGIQFDEHVYDFDLSMGGMLVRWSDKRIEKYSEVSHEVSTETTMSWRDVGGGVFLPVERHAKFVGKRNGEETQRSETQMHFSDFSVKPVSSEDLSVDQMGIPYGTPVVDTILGIQYLYAVGGEYGDDPDKILDIGYLDEAQDVGDAEDMPVRTDDTLGNVSESASQESPSSFRGLVVACAGVVGFLVLLLVAVRVAAHRRERTRDAQV